MKFLLKVVVVLCAFMALTGNPPRTTEAQAQVNIKNSEVTANVTSKAPSAGDKSPVAVQNEKKSSEAVAKTATSSEPKPQQTAISLTKQEIMQAAGIPESEWAAVDYIISHESSWRYTAVNKSSGATGLCQSLPASKMSSAGGDYLTNPVTQMKWCNSYAQTRYGGWWNAYAYWQAHRWW